MCFKVLYVSDFISFCNVNLFCAGSCGMSASFSIPSVGCGEHYAPLAPEGKVVDRYHMDGDIVFNIVYVCVILINFLILLTFCFQKISQFCGSMQSFLGTVPCSFVVSAAKTNF